MYRKELRRIQEMEENNQAITRVTSYPVVMDAWNKVSEVYQRGKDGSRVLRFCGGVVESSASLAYQASQPVIEKLPVEKVNEYAVSKLESLEENYPVIVRPTEEVVDAVKTYSTSKLVQAQTYSTNKVNTIAKVTGMEMMMNAAETVVDMLIPESPEERQEVEDAPEPSPQPLDLVAPSPRVEVLSRAVTLGNKVKRRAYHHAMAKAGVIHKRSQEAVSKLVHTVDLIDFARKNLNTERFEEAKAKVVSVYEEIVAEEADEELPADPTLERRAILSARILAKRIRSSMGAISALSSSLPLRARRSISHAYNSAQSLFQLLSSPDLLQQMQNRRDAVRSRLIVRIEELQAHVNDLGNQLLDAAQDLSQSIMEYMTGNQNGHAVMLEDVPRADSVQDEDEHESDAEDESSSSSSEEEEEENVSTDDSLLNSTQGSVN